MTTNRADVYIAVKTTDAAKVDELFKKNRFDFSVDEDVTGPFGSDETLTVFFFSEVKHANMEQETAVLLEHSIPFSLFHEEGSDFYYGWSHGRLNEDGSMSYTQYFGEGETLNITDIQSIMNNAETLEDAKKALQNMIAKQTYPDW